MRITRYENSTYYSANNCDHINVYIEWIIFLLLVSFESVSFFVFRT